MDTLAMRADPEWLDVEGAICVSCAKMLKPGKTIYAVAAEKFVKIDRNFRWVPDGITYVHGNSEAHAKEQYIATAERNTRIVAIGRVIGYYVEDTKGNVLSLD